MRLETIGLIESPAKYLESWWLTADPHGQELYPRYHAERVQVNKDFPHLVNGIADRRYAVDKKGSFLRSDLAALVKDIDALLAEVEPLDFRSYAHDRGLPLK
jgi:hypothetical protein